MTPPHRHGCPTGWWRRRRGSPRRARCCSSRSGSSRQCGKKGSLIGTPSIITSRVDGGARAEAADADRLSGRMQLSARDRCRSRYRELRLTTLVDTGPRASPRPPCVSARWCLTSSFSRSDPRPALTVTGGRVTGGRRCRRYRCRRCRRRRVLCLGQRRNQRKARRMRQTSPRETDSMKFSPRQTKRTRRTARARRGFRCQAGEGGARPRWLGPSRMPTGARASTATCGRSTIVVKRRGLRRTTWTAPPGSAHGQDPRQHSLHLAGRRHRNPAHRPGPVLGVHIDVQSETAIGPPSRISGGMGERLQEIEGNRKQRRGECRRAPTRKQVVCDPWPKLRTKCAANGRGSFVALSLGTTISLPKTSRAGRQNLLAPAPDRRRRRARGERAHHARIAGDGAPTAGSGAAAP